MPMKGLNDVVDLEQMTEDKWINETNYEKVNLYKRTEEDLQDVVYMIKSAASACYENTTDQVKINMQPHKESLQDSHTNIFCCSINLMSCIINATETLTVM